jgi:hypothetical protein
VLSILYHFKYLLYILKTGHVYHAERVCYCSQTFQKRHERFVTELLGTKPMIYLLVSILSLVMPFPKHGERDDWNRIMEERMEKLSVYSLSARTSLITSSATPSLSCLCWTH